MSNKENYIINNETNNKEKKKEYWEIGIGLNKVDDLEPSEYLLNLSQKNINGKLNYLEIENLLNKYYELHANDDEFYYKECDFVSLRIVELLENNNISIENLSLKTIHNFLFNDIYSFAGKYRNYDIEKREIILNGDTVIYEDYDKIENSLNLILQEEKTINYSKLTEEEQIKHIAEFTSKIWQVHPFLDGNTRTTAVFIIKYFSSIGFVFNIVPFKEDSIYFRNSLVRSNYTNTLKNIYPTFEYLNLFFENLLLNKNNKLSYSDIYIKELF